MLAGYPTGYCSLFICVEDIQELVSLPDCVQYVISTRLFLFVSSGLPHHGCSQGYIFVLWFLTPAHVMLMFEAAAGLRPKLYVMRFNDDSVSSDIEEFMHWKHLLDGHELDICVCPILPASLVFGLPKLSMLCSCLVSIPVVKLYSERSSALA
jgi:hypothetical protein